MPGIRRGGTIVAFSLLAAFVAACVLLALTPGPNMSLILANTTAHGLNAGLWTLAGAGTGLAILVAVAALGLGSVMNVMSEWFDVIRWGGALYLCILGARQLWSAWRSRGGAPAVRIGSQRSWYIGGLLVSLSNPKVLLFLGAFFPQFLDPARPAGTQLAVLAVLFVVTLVLVDLSYTIVVARLRRGLNARYGRLLDGVAGGLLLAGGAVLATLRRP